MVVDDLFSSLVTHIYNCRYYSDLVFLEVNIFKDEHSASTVHIISRDNSFNYTSSIP